MAVIIVFVFLLMDRVQKIERMLYGNWTYEEAQAKMGKMIDALKQTLLDRK
jgi:hypothetical protein